MVVNDFIMLGRTEPCPSKTHGITVCSAGYSREMGQFLRVYPLAMTDKTTKWSKCTIPLERNHRDGRAESWRLDNGHTVDSSVITIQGKVKKDSEFDYLESLAVESIQELNSQKVSLGILKSSDVKCFFSEEKIDDYPFVEYFGVITKMRPRIKIGSYSLQLRDWGAAEFLRKGQYPIEELWKSMRLTDQNYEHLFFVGNMQQHRNNWLIISTIMRKKKQSF
jgi:hypothetical protein